VSSVTLKYDGCARVWDRMCVKEATHNIVAVLDKLQDKEVFFSFRGCAALCRAHAWKSHSAGDKLNSWRGATMARVEQHAWSISTRLEATSESKTALRKVMIGKKNDRSQQYTQCVYRIHGHVINNNTITMTPRVRELDMLCIRARYFMYKYIRSHKNT
jgi:hypothetical protein